MNGIRLGTVSSEDRENKGVHLTCIKAEVWNRGDGLSHAASSGLPADFVNNLEVGSDPSRPTSMAVESGSASDRKRTRHPFYACGCDPGSVEIKISCTASSIPPHPAR